ncbi:MAG: HDOD domain-containing protein, partial [Spirochaetota bacterium]
PIEADFLFHKLANLLNRPELLPKDYLFKKLKLDLEQINIPALPKVISKVVAFDVNDLEQGVKEFEKILLPDVGITSNLLKLANSAFYGRSGKIHTLKDAISLIGVKSVRNIILMDFTKKMSKGSKNPLVRTYLREHPILSSLIAFDLAKPLGIDSVQESIFLLVLLKKIGMNILSANFQKNYLKILKLHEFNLKTIFELEKDEFQLTSIELGEKVFRTWNFSEDYIDAVLEQNFSIEKLDEVSDTNRLSRLSDIIAGEMLDIATSDEDKNLKNAIFSHYQVPEETAQLFGEDYYDMIKDHPFLNL